MTTIIHFLPQKSLGAVTQIEPELKVSCLFAPRELTVNIIRHNFYNLNDFFDDYCLKCDRLKSYNKKGKVNFGSCNGGLDVLIDGNCVYNKQAINGEECLSSCITTLPYIVSMPLAIKDKEAEEDPQRHFKIYVYDESKLKEGQTLYGLPYLLANVYQEGTVCWGSNNYYSSINADLRYLHNLFWIAPFNSDLLPNRDLDLEAWLHKCSLSALEEYEHDFHPEELHNIIKGDNCISISNRHSPKHELEAAFYSDDTTTVDRIANAKPKRDSDSDNDSNSSWYVAGWVYKGTYSKRDSHSEIEQGYYVTFGKQNFCLNIETKELGSLVEPVFAQSKSNTKVGKGK